ncbi:MAG: MFS transporter [Chloroflexota bacterium]
MTDRNWALLHRPFRIFWSGLVLSSLGTHVTMVAMAWQMYEITDSPLQVGMLGLARAIPQTLTLLLGGLLADALDRRRLLIVLQFGQCLVSAVLALLSSLELATPVTLYVATVFLALGAGLENPARQSLVPVLVPRSMLTSALAVNNSQQKLATILGPSLAGVILSVASPAWCYAIDACSWLAMLLSVWLVVPAAERGIARGLVSFHALAEGLSYVWHDRVIATLLALDLIANLFGTPRALLPVYARDILSVGPAGLGLLYAAGATGSLLTALVLSTFKRVGRPGLSVTLGLAVYGIGNILFAVSTDFPLSLALLAMTGAGDTYSAIVRGTVNQLSVPDELRGRVLSVSSMFTNSGPLLGQFRAGLVAEAWTPVLAGVSGGIVVVAACALAASSRAIRRYEVPNARVV